MKVVHSLVLLCCALWEAASYPYYPAYGNMDSMSYGSMDSSRGGMVMSRYYNPYYNPRMAAGGMATFMYRPEEQQGPQSGQYYYPDRRRQTTLEAYVPPQQNEVVPQQNEVYYSQQPENPLIPTEASEIADPTEKTEILSTTSKTIVPEIVEPESEIEEVEEPAPKPKKAVTSRKKQVKKPAIDDEDDDDSYAKVPASAFFPMFFGYGGRGAGGPGGPTAIANAYSTGRGGVATSHATAYGAPRSEQERYKSD